MNLPPLRTLAAVLSVLALVPAAALSVACSSREPSSTFPDAHYSFGSDSGTPPGDAGKDAPAPRGPCPTAIPPDAGACALATGLSCEYGTDYEPFCNTLASCIAGKWDLQHLTAAEDPGITCPSPTAGCPGALADITPLSTCDTTGTACLYAQGGCSCVMRTEGMNGGPIPMDASAWQCAPSTGCPWPRPRVGSPCTPSAVSCQYGDTLLYCPTGATGWLSETHPPF